MGVEKELLYQMLDRQIDNLIRSAAPNLAPFSGMAKQKIHSYIEPYLCAFMEPDGTVDVETGSAYLSNEAQAKIEAFKKSLGKESKNV